MRYSKWGFYCLLLLCLVSIPAVQATSEPIKIVLLGDSITHGVEYAPGYRPYLWQMLTDAEFSFDFVGSMQNDWEGQPFDGIDNDHEGHFGWRSTDVLNGTGNPQYGSGKLSDWLNSYTPDVALIHLGTNDVYISTGTTSEAADRLGQIITTLQADNPNMTILIAKIIQQQANPSWSQGLNQHIQNLTSYSTAQSEVIIVDQYTGFYWGQHTVDGTHPNEAGGERMAQVWFDALVPVLRGVPTATQLAEAPEATAPQVDTVLVGCLLTASLATILAGCRKP